MLDTNSVNFAISKMSLMWEKISPNLNNLSHEYVSFVVTQQVIQAAIFVCVFAIGLGMFLPSLSSARKVYFSEGIWILPFAVGVLAILVGTLGILVEGYEAILAVSCPDMFVIQRMIEAVK